MTAPTELAALVERLLAQAKIESGYQDCDELTVETMREAAAFMLVQKDREIQEAAEQLRLCRREALEEAVDSIVSLIGVDQHGRASRDRQVKETAHIRTQAFGDAIEQIRARQSLSKGDGK